MLVPDARRPRPPPHTRDDATDDPTPEDVDAFSGVTRTCPECNSEVYDQAELCWKCGHAFSGEPKALPSRWVVAIVILVVIVLAIGFLRYCS